MDTKPEFFTQLAKAAAEFGAIHRNKTVSVRTKAGGMYSFSYAPLEEILKAVTPALYKCGFFLSQHIEPDGEKEVLVTTLSHELGILSNRVRILVMEQGPQAYASATSYARRYGVTLLLCLSADDDDDGNAAEGNTATAVPKPVREQPPQPPAQAASVAAKFREAISVGIDQAVYDIHVEVVDDAELYQAVGSLLTAGERREIKEIIARVRAEMHADKPMQPNGRQAVVR